MLTVQNMINIYKGKKKTDGIIQCHQVSEVLWKWTHIMKNYAGALRSEVFLDLETWKDLKGKSFNQ